MSKDKKRLDDFFKAYNNMLPYEIRTEKQLNDDAERIFDNLNSSETKKSHQNIIKKVIFSSLAIAATVLISFFVFQNYQRNNLELIDKISLSSQVKSLNETIKSDDFHKSILTILEINEIQYSYHDSKFECEKTINNEVLKFTINVDESSQSMEFYHKRNISAEQKEQLEELIRIIKDHIVETVLR